LGRVKKGERREKFSYLNFFPAVTVKFAKKEREREGSWGRRRRKENIYEITN
jgi:hypothetical protein